MGSGATDADILRRLLQNIPCFHRHGVVPVMRLCELSGGDFLCRKQDEDLRFCPSFVLWNSLQLG